MSDMTPIAAYPPARVAEARVAYERPPRPEARPVRTKEDRVEVSPMASYLAKLRLLPAVRHNLVETIREGIAAGTYDTPDKLDAALDEMIGDAE